MSFVRVAFPVPVRQTFLYAVPPELEARAVPGAEVRCPFGSRERRGFIVERASQAGRESVKSIAGVVGSEPVFPPELLRLCAWIADYYFAPIGRVLAGALPGGLEGFGASRARKSALAATPEDAPDGAGAADATQGSVAEPRRFRLTDAQQGAVDAIAKAIRLSAYSAFLLHGVTGSGKTEVYLEAAQVARRSGRRTLVLVPEVALAHQLVQAFRARFGARIGVLHSYLPLGARRANWERARRGALDVVVGARSAVFAPLPSLGLVIVDEEHEAAYKQGEQIRYHGRDTALVRARFANAVALLGSATPSLETHANVERGKIRRLDLPERIDGRPLPVVEIVDLNERKPALFSAPLLDALAATRARREQAIVFLNRRGHTRVVECEDCGFVARCPSCDVALTYHSAGDAFRCHYCEHREPARGICPKCESPFFRHKGSGTQRAERELVQHLPDARVLRLDSDSARPRGEQARILGAFGRGEGDVLLGTQMIAKGLDFHDVTLVGVLSADGSLHLPDFRAAERTFQTLVQVAGRAGRGKRPGQVVVQTRAPDHYSLLAAARHDYATFARQELSYRRDLGYPPFGRLITLGLSGPDEERVIEAASKVAGIVREEIAAGPGEAGTRVLGPAPSPLPKLRGRHRWRITLKDAETTRLHAVARRALERIEHGSTKLPHGVLLSVDVDPYDVL
ncbi:MAG: replication restart helicase PriA [Candidatus Eiseniibacteriota bacterium]